MPYIAAARPRSWCRSRDPAQYAIRALLVQMMDWVWDVSSPPPSIYPQVAAGTLVPLEQDEFPELPGLEFPKAAHDT